MDRASPPGTGRPPPVLPLRLGGSTLPAATVIKCSRFPAIFLIHLLLFLKVLFSFFLFPRKEMLSLPQTQGLSLQAVRWTPGLELGLAGWNPVIRGSVGELCAEVRSSPLLSSWQPDHPRQLLRAHTASPHSSRGVTRTHPVSPQAPGRFP